MRDWFVDHRRQIIWGIFIGLGIAGGLLSTVHPALIILVGLVPIGYYLMIRAPEVFVPLYVYSGLYKAVLPVDTTILFFGCAVGAAGLKVYKDRQMITRILRHPAIFILSLFAFWILLSLIYTRSGFYAVDKAARTLILTFGALPLAMVLIDSEKKLRNVIVIVAGLGTWMGTISAITGSRTVFQANYLSLGFTTSTAILLFIFYFIPKTKNIGFIVPILLNCIGLLNSAARAPVLFTPLMMIVVVTLSRLNIQAKIRSYVLLIMAGCALVAGLYIAVPDIFQGLVERMGAINDLENDHNAQFREALAQTALDLFISSPVTGVGIGSFGYYMTGEDGRLYPHNVFLEIGSELGLIGLFLFSVLFYIVLHHHFTKETHGFIDNTLLCMVLYTFINMLKAGDLTDNRAIYMFFGIILVKEYVMRKEESR